MVVHTVTSLDEYRKLAKEHGKIMMKFTATWCGPCRMIAPEFESLSEEYKDIYFVTVDVDNTQDLSAEFEINSMPTFYSIKNGEKQGVIKGANREKLFALTQNLQTL